MKTKFVLMFAVVAMMAATGCKTDGCTDPNAVNFDSEADNNDGSCQFEGEVVFWYNEAAADGLIDFGSNSLTFYVDGAVVGSTAANVFWTAGPACGANGSITVTRDLGNTTNIALPYRVEDDFGDVIWDGIVNFSANTCEAVELVW
jgi:hypothetical protein